MYAPFAFSRTVKFALAALFGIVLATPAQAAKYTTMTDLGGDVVNVNIASGGSIKDVFSSGAGISNGTLNVKYPSGVWGTISGLNFTIAKDAILNFNTTKTGDVKDGELNIKGGSVVTLDGGTFNNNNSRTSDFNDIGNDGTDGTLRIIHGGKFTGTKTNLQIGNKQGSTGIVSIDDGTVDVGSHYIYVAPNRDAGYPKTTGILAVTNGVVKANNDIALCEKNSGVAKLSFVDSKLTISRIRKTKDPASGSFCIMDGCTINSTYKEMLSDLGSIPYQLEGKGLIANPSVDSAMCGTYVSRVTDRGPGPIVKKGPKTVTFKGKLDGSADLRVEEGTLAFSGATLPAADNIALTISGTGAFEGLDQSATYKSLTLGEDAVLPVVFENGKATTFKAAEIIITATADHPVVIDGIGALTADTVVVEGLTVTDDSLFVLNGIAGSLKLEDGKLIAVKPSRLADTLTWAKGSAGDSWNGEDNWTYGDPATATTFQTGDSAIFATAGAQAVVDADVTAAKVEFKANATVTGMATLATTNLTVDAGVTATIAAPLSEDIEKTGKGELVLQDYKAGKVLDLKEGQVTLAWSEAAKANPFSTATDANVIAGVLDLGSATQHVSSHALTGNGGGILRNGGVLLNGKLEIDPDDYSSANNWWRLQNTTFTVGKGATLEILKTTNQDGEMGFMNGACLVIDGGRVNALNGRGGGAGAYLGCDKPGVNTIRIQNGGVFYEPNQFLRVGYNGGGTGILSVDGGTVDLGKQELRIACDGATGVFAMTNGVLTAKSIQFSEVKSCLSTFILKDSVAKVEQFKKGQTPAAGSTVLFDGATLVPTAEGSFLPDLGIEATIGANGLIISNDYDVTVSTPLTGEGKFVKMGKGSLTLNGVQTNYTGNIEVTEGTFGFGSAVAFADVEEPTRTLSVAGGATVEFGYTANAGFAGAKHFLFNPTGEGKIKLTVNTSTLPKSGEYYPLFAGEFEESITNRLEVMAGYVLEVQEGKLMMSVAPQTARWIGEDPDSNGWSKPDNWNTRMVPGLVDTVEFNGDGAETTYDLENGLAFQRLDVACGAWTTKVDQVSFANTPLALSQFGSFTLTGAKNVTNPFSTAKDKNSIAGILDFGGATQTFTGTLADEKGFFRNGGEIRNVALTIDPAGWFRLHNVSFTIGKDADVTVKKYTDNKGQLNLYSSYLKIDGGSLTALNERSGSNTGAYIGNNGDATIEILNGGKFYHPNKRVILGYGADGKGAGYLIGDHATVDLGNQTLNLGNRNGSASCLALTNSTLTCSEITLGFEGTPGKQTIELVDTTVNFGQLNVEKLGSNSSVLFDGATLVDNHGATALLSNLGIPCTIGEGGLIVKVANRTADDDYVSFPGTFNGEGDFILVAAGKTPRVAKFTGEKEKGFTGNVVVSNGVTVVAGGKTFKGGLYACKGSTLDVATSTFEGDIEIEDGVSFATEGVTMKGHMTNGVLVAKTTGKITLPEGALYDKTTRNGAYVVEKNGYSELYYGRRLGFVMLLK